MLEEATCSSLLLLLFIPLLLRLPHTILADNSTATIRIGSLLAANSTIGTVAQQAILLALHHINSDPSLLHSWKLELQSFDTNCSAFQAAAAAIELMEQEVVAIVGPQSSTSAHFIAQMANTVQVPLLSFSATDPALSEYQYPFFFRIVHSDAVQMEGVAALVSYYGWREIVAIYTDDDFGTNGISALDDALVSVGARIVHKAALPPGIDTSEISNLLIKLTVIESRVFVVHMQQDIALTLFTTANNLELMTTGYAWIITDSMAATLDTSVLDTTAINSIQGIIGTHTFIPLSSQYQSFLNQWKEFQGQLVTSTQLHIYGLYAYDSMWVIAHALDSLLKNALNFTFEDKTGFPSYAGGNSELAKLKTFKEGPLLRQEILRTKLNGTSGPIQLDRKGDLMGSVFEIVNVVGKALHTVGYWSNQTGISSSLPGGLDGEPVSLPLTPPVAKKLNGVIWPGSSLQKPRGWVLTNNGRPLRIAVPHKVGYEQFVTIGNSSNSSEFQGFCIDVFLKALKYLPYGVTYKFFPYGSGSSTPIYDEIIQQLANQAFPKDSQLAIDLSTAILSISESGELQKIHDIWLTGGYYGNTDTQVQSDQLGLGSFWGLFLVTGVASVLCLFIYIGRLLWGFSRSSDASYLSEGGRSFSSRGAGFIKSFASYMDEHGNPKSRSRNREGKVTARSDQSPSGSSPDTSEEV